LRDGTPVIVRAIRLDDRGTLISSFNELDPDSVYTRFFTYKKSLSEAEARRLTDVDFNQVVALLVVKSVDGKEGVIGGGRYAIENDAEHTAELAFLTAEHCRGQGVARIVLKHLIEIGRQQGLSRMIAYVLAQNHSMLRVFEKCGLPMTARAEAGVINVKMELRSTT
jgi:RimJ/RimL family protein N-acetyltransferase